MDKSTDSHFSLQAKCPHCAQICRFPAAGDKLRITCPSCRNQFIYDLKEMIYRTAGLDPLTGENPRQRQSRRKWMLPVAALLVLGCGAFLFTFDWSDESAALDPFVAGQMKIAAALEAGDLDAWSRSLVSLPKSKPLFRTDEELKYWLEEGVRQGHPGITATYARLQLEGYPSLGIDANESAAIPILQRLGALDFGKGYAALYWHYNEKINRELRNSYTSGASPDSGRLQSIRNDYLRQAARAGALLEAEFYYAERYKSDPGAFEAIRQEINGLTLSGYNPEGRKEAILDAFERQRPQIEAYHVEVAERERRQREKQAQDERVRRNAAFVEGIIREIDGFDFQFRDPPQRPNTYASVNARNRYGRDLNRWSEDYSRTINRLNDRRNQLFRSFANRSVADKIIPTQLDEQFGRSLTNFDHRRDEAEAYYRRVMAAAQRWFDAWK
ncbi:MAG: hypothetical protein ACNA77_05535 [Opitutales bacterium]